MSMSIESEKQTITVTKNGPYLVSRDVPISEYIIVAEPDGTAMEWQEGKKYQYEKKCELCRCGESKHKPFCDRTHLMISFDGTEVADRELVSSDVKEINGPTLKLSDAEILCASARFCHRAGGIWNLVLKSSNYEAQKTATEEACDCPSGRLVLHDKKTDLPLEPGLERSIGLVEDPQLQCSGPIWVRGRIPILSPDGRAYQVRNRVTLCRCGKSTNKPFCDSSHFPEHLYEEMVSRQNKDHSKE